MTRAAIAGIGGRMGRNVAALIQQDSSLTLAGGIIRPGSPVTLDTVRDAINEPGWPGTITTEPEEILPHVDVLVDFTNPEGAMQYARACQRTGTALVSGTTGLNEDQFAELRRIAEQVPVFYAENMSVGISAILAMLPDLVRILDGYDVEIVESHHAAKSDAPSGTALRLAEAVREATRNSEPRELSFGREGFGARRPGEIGIHAVRAGGNPGEHSLVFASDDEQLEIKHRSFNRLVYARGALRAVRLVSGKTSGFFTPADLMG
jgi:4-hydroxy-tetrahydrodipicolinate reductase